jgi:TetR/AcrR family transcriptional regulator, mexJK operon transcriptional repressor
MKKIAQKRAAGRPKDPEKRAALIRAAARLFTTRGYGETSIEQVAQEAGVSKLTVYSHFEGKEHLFSQVIEGKCEQHFGGRDLTRFADRKAEEALPEIARRFVDLLLNDEVIAMHRMMLGASNSHADLCQLFWDSGPAPALASLAELLRHYHERGELHVPDADWAADHFFALLHGKLHLRATLGIGRQAGRRQVAELLASAVGVFLRAHAPAAGAGGSPPAATRPTRSRRRRQGPVTLDNPATE